MYFVQIHTSCYIKVPNFVLNTWLPHYQIDLKMTVDSAPPIFLFFISACPPIFSDLPMGLVDIVPYYDLSGVAMERVQNV